MKHDIQDIQRILDLAKGVPWAEGVDGSMREQLVKRGFKYRISPLNAAFQPHAKSVTLESSVILPDELLGTMPIEGDVATAIVKTLSVYVGIDLADLFLNGNRQSSDSLLSLADALGSDTHYRLDCVALTVQRYTPDAAKGGPQVPGISANITLLLQTQPY